jgi:hypothetical protein
MRQKLPVLPEELAVDMDFHTQSSGAEELGEVVIEAGGL